MAGLSQNVNILSLSLSLFTLHSHPQPQPHPLPLLLSASSRPSLNILHCFTEGGPDLNIGIAEKAAVPQFEEACNVPLKVLLLHVLVEEYKRG